MLMAPRDRSMCEAKLWIILVAVHEVYKIKDHVSAAEHVRVEAEDVVSGGVLGCSFACSEEAWERLAKNLYFSIAAVTRWNSTFDEFVSFIVRVVTDDYFARVRAEWFEFLES
jgi:hypothetical protein